MSEHGWSTVRHSTDRITFINEYAVRAHTSPERLARLGFEAVPCDCTWRWCSGWKMVRHDVRPQ